MAGQDFAKNGSPRPPEPAPTGQMKALVFILLALGVVAGGFAAGFHFGQQMGMSAAPTQEMEKLRTELKAQQEELARLRAEASKPRPETTTTRVGELTFYNELPKQSVDPAPLNPRDESEAAPVATPVARENRAPAPAVKASDEELRKIIEQELGRGADTGHVRPTAPAATAMRGDSYLLQLASFQKQSEADNFLPKLDAAGFSGSVRRVELAGKGVWYRVYAGPFASKDAAEEAKLSAKEKLKISGLVVKGG